MNIAIIDDDIDFIQALRHEVEKYMESRQIEYTIDTYKDSQYPELLDNIQASEYYDLFLLDIQMTAINGLDLAHEIQMKYIEPTFLFITNFYRYAMECYVYSAVRYILKVDYVKKLPEALDACVKKIYQIKEREERKIIVIEDGRSIYKCFHKDIYFIQKEHKHIVVHLRTEQRQFKMTLDKIMKALDSSMFVYADRGVIVNLQHINEIRDYMVYLDNGEVVTESVARDKPLRAAIIRYIGEQK